MSTFLSCPSFSHNQRRVARLAQSRLEAARLVKQRYAARSFKYARTHETIVTNYVTMANREDGAVDHIIVIHRDSAFRSRARAMSGNRYQEFVTFSEFTQRGKRDVELIIKRRGP